MQFERIQNQNTKGQPATPAPERGIKDRSPLVRREIGCFNLILKKRIAASRNPESLRVGLKHEKSAGANKTPKKAEPEELKTNADIAARNLPDDTKVQTASTMFSASRSMERDDLAIVQARISHNDYEDINRLIKKLALSFTAKKSESDFTIGEGIFKGSHFHVSVLDRSMSMEISKASHGAEQLLLSNQGLLKNRLGKHEINLDGIRFIS